MFGSGGSIDVERLRDDMESESLGAFFGGGFGGALMEASDIRSASDDEVIEMARRQGIDLDAYLE